jgi:hypothetical protein
MEDHHDTAGDRQSGGAPGGGLDGFRRQAPDDAPSLDGAARRKALLDATSPRHWSPRSRSRRAPQTPLSAVSNPTH